MASTTVTTTTETTTEATSTALPPLMKAWVLHGKEDMRLEERPVPTPGAGEVLLQIGSVGVCGSDKHMFFEGRASSDILRAPVVLGHEFGGTIVGVGEGIDPARLGVRVAVEPLVPDWTSREAREGRYNIDPNQRFFGVPGLDGALQQYLVVPSDNAHAIPDSVSDDAAAMVETISVALNGVEKAALPMGSRVVIVGGGPVGLFVAQLCRAQGVGTIALVEPQESRRNAAAGFGCVTYSDLAEAGGDYDAFIDCTGVASVRHDGCYTVRPGGRAVFIGVGAEDATVPMPAVIEREVSIHGVMRYAFTWPKVIAMLEAGLIEADGLVSRTLRMDDALEAWTRPLATEVKTMVLVGE
ncbi:sorbitol dehydrogenase [Subtercola boreus]|uniref:Sorbitol dehydrogenase n=1 Tax=Subtercola boreus TaxID=120213 RepID=A0A3E0VCP3_9MICO|nr:alcohol dehydrogenase catalytic domain-containing protein [Subtercola boreus]RFA07160.1 sorbitol dehydrogenase [Subtercola boreus]